MTQELDALYKDIILDHQKSPRNFGTLPDADVLREGFNPMCGDHIFLELKYSADRKKISACRFRGEGCSICMASASIMTEEVAGESVDFALREIAAFRELMKGTKLPDDFEGDIEALAGVRKFPVRIKCALLAWTTLKDALEHGTEDGNFTKTE